MEKQPKMIVVNISFQLEGEEAERFLAYKQAEFLKNNAEAARRIVLTRLNEDPPPAQPKLTNVRAKKRTQANAGGTNQPLDKRN